ncbi:GGDEF domain-containing protein [Roseovarius aestuarii]|uniref:Putative diguanylate cyclase YegE n=1 Tax=Roseovarius aestuarii TaxID=475083 RepID=A0A1X7BVV1_9RHOB|nr:GGDEF domain-containing protein [Roseovarius aestuarii]SMC13359.1 putative diguanylate cyclase YegE [Roseovarius aestuarii]
MADSIMSDEILFKNAPVGIARVGTDGTFLQVNQRFCEILGLSEETLVCLRLHHITHPGDIESAALHMRRLLSEDHGRFNMAKRFIRGDGSILWTDLNVSFLQRNERQDAHFIVVIQDMTKTRSHIDVLEHKLRHDPLTRIRNRAGFIEHLSRACRRYQRNGSSFALAYLDLDNFKEINDTLGHVTGDILLREVATRLQRMMENDGTVARLSGDEFAVVLTNITTPEMLNAALYRLHSVFGAPFEANQAQVDISASIGLAHCPMDAHTVRGLMQHADKTMYAQKNASASDRSDEPQQRMGAIQ